MSNTISPKPTLTDYVSKDPAVLGGKPCITGTRVRVQDVYVLFERQRKSVDEILAAWPHLTHAQIHAALAYAWENRDEILDLLKRAEEFDRELERRGKSLLDKTLERLHGQTNQILP